MTTNKVTGLVITTTIVLDKRAVEGGEALSLGACIQALTTEGWRLTHVLEGDDGSLTAVLWRGWDVGVRPPPAPTEMSKGEYDVMLVSPQGAHQEEAPTCACGHAHYFSGLRCSAYGCRCERHHARQEKRT